MRLIFGYPSSGEETGGVMALYEYANALARRGHDVTFVHGPAWPTRVNAVDELPPICFRDGVRNLVVDTLEDPAIPHCDVVFTHNAPAALGKPAIVVQGFGMLSPEWEEQAFRVAAPKICVARWLIEVGTSFGVPAEEFVHAPCGIDHEIFAPPASGSDRPIDLAGLYHPHREKGWPVLLEVFRRLAAERNGFRGVVFARNPPADELPPGVEFVHSPDHQQLAREVYGKTKVFAQASLREGFGLTPVESMACGAALVTTDNGGSGDYAIPEQTALVVDVGDVDGLAVGVASLLDAPDRRSELSRAGAEHVRRFDWDRSAAAIESMLERYLREPESFRGA